MYATWYALTFVPFESVNFGTFRWSLLKIFYISFYFLHFINVYAHILDSNYNKNILILKKNTILEFHGAYLR